MKDERAQRPARRGVTRVLFVLYVLSVPLLFSVGNAEEQTTSTLSLTQLFGGAETPQLPTRNTLDEELTALVESLGGLLNEEHRPRLYELSERLLTLLHPSDPRWVETLAQRAVASLRDHRHEQFRRLTGSYLESAPSGPRAAWLLEQRARLAAADAAWPEAAADWAAALALADDRTTTMPMQTILPALEAMARGGRAPDAVALSRRISWEHASAMETDLAMLWLLDAHLQDGTIAAPPPALKSQQDSVLLRRALLALRDGRTAEARAIAARIEVARLRDAEAAIHERYFGPTAPPAVSILHE